MGETCSRPRQVTTAVAQKLMLNSLRAPQPRNTAQSCSSGCGSITGDMPAGRAGWLCQLSPFLLRVVSLRRAQALRHRVHLPPPRGLGRMFLTHGTGTTIRILSVSPHPSPILVAPRRSRAQRRPQLLMPGQPSSRTGIHLSQVGLSLRMCCCIIIIIIGPALSKMLFSLQSCVGMLCIS